MALGTNVSTPLLLLYQESLGLSAWTVTALFAVYPLGLLPMLLWAGPASDVLGRRAVMMPGLVASALASALFFVGAEHLAVLFVARLLLGAVSGAVFVVASAWIAEVEPSDDPLWPSRLTSIVLCAGFGGGPFVSGMLGQWAPWPLRLSYVVHIGIVILGSLALTTVPETVPESVRQRRDPIRPSFGVPPATRRVFWSVVAPTAVCVFGFASLSFGLFPVLLRPAMESIAVFVTGVVSGITAVAMFAAQRLVGRIGPARAVPMAFACGGGGCLLGTVAFATGVWALTFPGAALLGGAAGLALTSGLRFVDQLTVPASRGAMTGAFYAAAYSAMMMPLVVSTVAHSRWAYVAVLSVVTSAAVAGVAWTRAQLHLLPDQGERAPSLEPDAVPTVPGL